MAIKDILVILGVVKGIHLAFSIIVDDKLNRSLYLLNIIYTMFLFNTFDTSYICIVCTLILHFYLLV